jgi:hypothetical protein
MAVEYETLVQGGHEKLAEEIFEKVKGVTDDLDERIDDVEDFFKIIDGKLCIKWRKYV